jgi:hypothetical protein
MAAASSGPTYVKRLHILQGRAVVFNEFDNPPRPLTHAFLTRLGISTYTGCEQQKGAAVLRVLHLLETWLVLFVLLNHYQDDENDTQQKQKLGGTHPTWTQARTMCVGLLYRRSLLALHL